MTREWPRKQWPGAVVDVGQEKARALLEQVPADKRVFDFEEVLGMVGALGSLPETQAEWREWLEGHVEHMAAGGYVIGSPAP